MSTTLVMFLAYAGALVILTATLLAAQPWKRREPLVERVRTQERGGQP